MKSFIPSTLVEEYFAALSAIPRPSEHEQAVSDYVCSVAEKLRLRYVQDHMGNVVVYKPASPGREGEPAVMLQAHMDMVTVCAPGTTHDFLREPLTLCLDEQGHLRAQDTTLGADDGYGCAYMLAALTESFSHPPLECVFTVQEENGCWGARALDTALISARRMIGLDTMGEDVEYTCCVSCYCSNLLTITAQLPAVTMNRHVLCVRLDGVQPVRTGALVHPEQGNAIKLLTRLLLTLPEGIQLISLAGGEAENYNPVTCEAMLLLPDGMKDESAASQLREALRVLTPEVDDGSQALRLTIEAGSMSAMALTPESTRRILALMDLVPSATVEIDPRDGRMTATNNVGIVSLENGDFRLVMSDRGQNPACLDGVERRVRQLCALCGCTLTMEKRYEPWPYRPDSPLLHATAALMRETYGHDMVESICPGGLELCDFLPGLPDLDCVMFAPLGGACHSTMEWMDLLSFNRVYAFLKELLRRI